MAALRSHNTTICWTQKTQTQGSGLHNCSKTYMTSLQYLRTRPYFFLIACRGSFLPAEFSVNNVPHSPKTHKGVWFSGSTQCRSYTSPFCFTQIHSGGNTKATSHTESRRRTVCVCAEVTKSSNWCLILWYEVCKISPTRGKKINVCPHLHHLVTTDDLEKKGVTKGSLCSPPVLLSV